MSRVKREKRIQQKDLPCTENGNDENFFAVGLETRKT